MFQRQEDPPHSPPGLTGESQRAGTSRSAGHGTGCRAQPGVTGSAGGRRGEPAETRARAGLTARRRARACVPPAAAHPSLQSPEPSRRLPPAPRKRERVQQPGCLTKPTGRAPPGPASASPAPPRPQGSSRPGDERRNSTALRA